MIEDLKYPILENPKVDKSFAIHVTSGKEYPFIGCTENEGFITANSDRFYIDIEGLGGHAMRP